MAAPEEDQEPRNLEEPLMTLSNLGRTVDGSGLAYRSVECSSKRIGVIKAIEAYTQLHHIDLSRNMIKDAAPLKGLKFCLKLNLSFNEIKDIKGWAPEEGGEPVFPQLRDLDLSNNALVALLPLGMESLRVANFAKNDISNCTEFGGHPAITDLNLSENRLATLTGIANMPSLTKLDVSAQREQLIVEETEVKGKKGKEKKEKAAEAAEDRGTPEPGGLVAIDGLAEVGALQELNLSKNRFSALEGAWDTIPLLTSINLSDNLLSKTRSLEVLRALPKLKALKIDGNAFTNEAGEPTEPAFIRTEVIVAHWRLAEIDEKPVTAEELEQAKEENVKRLLEERERKEAEAKAAAEAEGGGE